MLKSVSTRIAATCLIGLLAAAVLLASWATYRRTQHVPEYAFGCDSFGYLRMARQIRLGTADFHLPYDQTKQLVQALQDADVPFARWEELVAPHAHHYFPRTNAVGPQYPPGTALFLAMFPEGRALAGLNNASNLSLTIVGLVLMCWAARLRAWLPATAIALATLYGLTVLGEIGVSSFSINAMLVPVLLAILCTHFSSWSNERNWRRPLFGLAAGAFFGLAILIRMPILFLAPGLAILLWPRSWRVLWKRDVVREPLPMFLLGIACFGVIPMLWHQDRVAGAWNLPTYGLNDTAPPSLQYVPEHTLFYLRQGGTQAMGHGLILVLALMLLVSLRSDHDRSRQRRMLVAIFATWAIPLAYFVTHRVTTHYYLLPSTFATLWMIALGFLARWRDAQPSMANTAQTQRNILAACVAALSLILAANLFGKVPDSPPSSWKSPSIPAEFQEGKPWIWADMTSGTLVYYGDVPAFKLIFGDRETRYRVYSIAFASGERQFLVDDCPSMTEIAAEVRAMHGTLELRGDFASYPYYLIHWPAGGPVWVPGQ